MTKYKDEDKELLKTILAEDKGIVLSEKEFLNYKNFIEDKNGRKYFTPEVISERLAKRNNILIGLLEPFFFSKQLISFTKVRKFMLSIVQSDVLETFEIELTENIYIETRQDGSFPEMLTTIVRFLKNKINFHIKNKNMKLYKSSNLNTFGKTYNINLLIKSNFAFKIRDISFLLERGRDGFMSKYMGLDEVVFAPSKFIEYNELNKAKMLKLAKKHGVGKVLFGKGFNYTENEMRKLIIPALSKTKNSFLFMNRDRVFMKLVLTQHHIPEEMTIDIINKLKTTSEFVSRLKRSKMIKRIYKDKPAVLLFIDML
jgi:hypothetical protein